MGVIIIHDVHDRISHAPLSGKHGKSREFPNIGIDGRLVNAEIRRHTGKTPRPRVINHVAVVIARHVGRSTEAASSKNCISAVCNHIMWAPGVVLLEFDFLVDCERPVLSIDKHLFPESKKSRHEIPERNTVGHGEDRHGVVERLACPGAGRVCGDRHLVHAPIDFLGEARLAKKEAPGVAGSGNPKTEVRDLDGHHAINGAEVKHALLGAGIESSHSYERTHIDSVLATERMVDAYLKSELVY